MRSALMRTLEHFGIGINDFVITEKELVVEVPLAAGQNSYTGNLHENNNERPLEVKLNRNDAFILTHLGMAVRKQDETTSPKRYGNYRDFTTADANYFVGAAGGNSEAFAVSTLWNAKLTLNANNVDIIDEFPTARLEYVPERGHLIAGGTQVGDEFPQLGPGLEERGFSPYVVNHLLSGQLDNTIKLSGISGDTTLIAGGVNGAGAAIDTSNVLRLKLYGFELAGAATAAEKWAAIRK